jgi:hypothetical protein
MQMSDFIWVTLVRLRSALLVLCASSLPLCLIGFSLAAPHANAASAAEEAAPHNPDKWELWSGPTCLRGANIWQKRVKPDDAMGPGPVGPPYPQEDLQHLAAWGANYVNISHPGVFSEQEPYAFDPRVFDHLTALLDKAERAGLFAVVAFRTGPGRNEAIFGGEQEKKLDALWNSLAAQEAWVDMWRETARRLKDRSVVVGYELMVEPETKNHRLWNTLAQKITRAIRQIDPRVPILVGGADWSDVDALDFLQPTGDSRTVYVVHQYEPYSYTHQKRKNVSDKPEKLAEAYRKIRKFKSRYEVPMAVNEFGAVRWATDVDQFIGRQMQYLEELGANHALWLWETSFPLNYDEFNFRHGPDRGHHADVSTSALIEVIQRNWKLNQIRWNSKQFGEP